MSIKYSPERIVIDSPVYSRLKKLVKKHPIKFRSIKQAANLILHERLDKEKV